MHFNRSEIRQTNRKERTFYMINFTYQGNQAYDNVASRRFGRFTGFQRPQTAFLLNAVD